MRLRLIDHVSHGLTSISHRFAAIHGHAAALNRTLNQIRLTAITGFAVGATGIFGLLTLRGPYEAARNFNTEVAKFNALGLGDHARTQAIRFVSAMDTIGTSLQDKIELYRDAMTVFRGDEHHAEMVVPTLAKMRFAMETLHGGEHAGNMDRQFMDLLRVMELRGGLVSETRALQEMNFAFQTLNTSGGRVNPQALLAFMQTSGQAGRSLSPEALYYGFEPIIQEVGGPRAGTALMTMMNRFMTGRFVGQGGRAAGEEMLRLGLLDRSRVEFNQSGQFMRYKAGQTALVDAELFTSNPFEWFHRYMLPAQRRAGIDTNAEFLTSNLMTGSRTGARLLDIWRVQEPIIRRGIEMARHAQTIQQAYDAATDTERGLEIGTTAKWRDLMIRLGQAVIPMAVAGMQTLIPMLESMEQWVTRNPGKVRFLVTAFAALSAAMAIGGVVMLLTAAFQALGMALGLLVGRGAIFAMMRALSMGLIPGLIALAGVIGAPALLIWGIVIALGALGVWLYNNVEPFRNAVDGIIGALGRFFDFIASKNTTQADGRLLVAPAAGSVLRTSGLFDAEGRVTEFGRATVAGYLADGAIPESVRAAWEARQQGGGSPYVRQRPANNNTPPANVYLDGRIVGEVVTDRQAQTMRGPASGVSSYDPTMAPAYHGFAYAPR